MKEEFVQGLNKVKNGLKGALKKVTDKKSKQSEDIDKIPLSDDAVDLSRAEELDRGGEGVSFYDTENSELSRGAPKSVPRGLDSFGEKDTFDFDEVDDYQTDRDRNQNSDLSKRFHTKGLDTDDIDISRGKRQ